MDADKQTLKIISGGQSGADRAGLDWAIQRGFEHGGWCPKGRRSEDGGIPEKYHLQETASSGYQERTERNIVNSDCTIIFSWNPVSAGTRMTVDFCWDHQKPFIVIDYKDANKAIVEVRNFVDTHCPKVINIAGNRESVSPGIYAFVRNVLEGAISG